MTTKMITIGVLTPHAAPGPETELPGMAPTSVRVRVSRATQPAVRGSEELAPPTSPAALRALAVPQVLDRAVSAFPRRADLDVLAFASTSSGYALGHDEQAALVEHLERRWVLPACATSLAMVAALCAHHVRRVSLVHPPWFGSALDELGAAYFAREGFEVVGARLADVPGDPEHVRPDLVSDWVRQHLSVNADAVVLGGNGLRAAQVIDALEATTGRLVVQANQALLWSALTRTGAAPVVHGFGTLLHSVEGREVSRA